jgi:IcmF-related N-terminal domain
VDMLNSIVSSQVAMVVFGVVAALTAGAAFMWSKHPVRWILVLLTIGLLYLLFIKFDPDGLSLDPQLPGEFYWWLRAWLLVLGLIVLYAVPHLISVLYWNRRGRAGSDASESRFPDLESAWDEVVNRLSQARYDVANQNVFLLLSTDESLAAGLVKSSGMNLFVAAPTATDAPIHAYASADGLFLSCAGASAWGRQDGEGTQRLELLCRKIVDLSPEQPTLRGIAVLFPTEKATAPETLKQIGPLRNDLQTIQSELKVRCPVIAVFCTQEAGSGFHEFAARMPASLRNNRCGFSTPTVLTFDHGVADRGLRWYAQWLQSWSLNLMVQDYLATEGNSKLVEMNAEMRRDIAPLCTLVETAFSTHARSQPVMVRGCYFATIGPGPDDHAFVGGLARGARGKMIGDAPLTSWAQEAGVLDRRYKLTALAIGLAAAAVALPIWLLSILPRLKTPTSGMPNGMGWLGWTGLGLLALVWVVGLSYLRLRGRSATKAVS